MVAEGGGGGRREEGRREAERGPLSKRSFVRKHAGGLGIHALNAICAHIFLGEFWCTFSDCAPSV